MALGVEGKRSRGEPISLQDGHKAQRMTVTATTATNHDNDGTEQNVKTLPVSNYNIRWKRESHACRNVISGWTEV